MINKKKNFKLKIKNSLDDLIPASKKYKMLKFSQAVDFESFFKKLSSQKKFIKIYKNYLYKNKDINKFIQNNFQNLIVNEYFSSKKVKKILLNKVIKNQTREKNIHKLLKKNVMFKKLNKLHYVK